MTFRCTRHFFLIRKESMIFCSHDSSSQEVLTMFILRLLTDRLIAYSHVSSKNDTTTPPTPTTTTTTTTSTTSTKLKRTARVVNVTVHHIQTTLFGHIFVYDKLIFFGCDFQKSVALLPALLVWLFCPLFCLPCRCHQVVFFRKNGPKCSKGRRPGPDAQVLKR